MKKLTNLRIDVNTITKKAHIYDKVELGYCVPIVFDEMVKHGKNTEFLKDGKILQSFKTSLIHIDNFLY